MDYVRRIVDDQLDELMEVLPAIAIEGAKAVGKTATAKQRSTTVFTLDEDEPFEIVESNPSIVSSGVGTTFIDEWPLVPSVWNVVRHVVDDGATPGRYLLAGSSDPSVKARLHSGAGRIVRLLMRPMSLPGRGIEAPTVSLKGLLSGEAGEITGTTEIGLVDYVAEILASGFPAIRSSSDRARPHLLRSYVDRIVDHDIEEVGGKVRRPESLREWMRAYGAATATTASYNAILSAATPGQTDKPAKQTAMTYRNLLERLWIVEPLSAWTPSLAHLDRIGQSPKHHLVDPALAAVMVGATRESLLQGGGPSQLRRDGTFLGALFESLVTQTVRVLAQVCGARVGHFRVRGGDHEVDLIVERPDRRVVAIEVKLSSSVRPTDVTGLKWLKNQAKDLVIDRVVINTGTRAHRRPDGIAVVPFALLGL
jgi:predicted AAA+ superfamily ATPase